MEQGTCVICAGPLSGRQTKYCSHRCKMTGHAAAQRANPGTPEAKAKKAAWAKAHRHLYVGRYTETKTCERCKKSFEVRAGEPNRFCSNGCSMKWQHERGRRRQRARAKLKRSMNLTSRLVMAQGRCSRCGQQFVALGPKARWCSLRCKQNESTSLRRARSAGVDITRGERFRVFEGAGWLCHICSGPLDRAAVVPDPNSAVIDHYIPLAAGGAHAPSNWKAAHFLCNSFKGAAVPAA